MEWKSLQLKDKQIVDDALKRNPMNLSDYSFTNLWMWNELRDYHLAYLDGFLCIKFIEKGDLRFLYPIGNGSRKSVIEKLLIETPFFKMRAVPEEGIPDLMGLPFSIEAETSHFDYIYAFDDLLYLHGNHFQAKRNFIHQFESLYPFEFKTITPELIPKVIDAENEWYETHPERASTMAAEHTAILRGLNAFSDLRIEGGALQVEQKIIAFTLAEKISKEMVVIHAEKALSDFKGVYAMINQQMLKHLSPVLYVNREEDLGLDNLTHVKQSYHPLFLAKKYLLYTS